MIYNRDINGFYLWWTELVHGNHINNKNFDLVVKRFENIKMKKLKKLSELKELEKNSRIYILLLTPYSRVNDLETEVFKGDYSQVVVKLKEVFDYESYLEDMGYVDSVENTLEFIEYCSGLNGDGADWIELIKLND